MSNTSTQESKTSMTFEERHVMALKLLKTHKEEIEDYDEIVYFMTELHSIFIPGISSIRRMIATQREILTDGLRSLKNKQWVKENKSLFGTFE